MRKLLLAGVSVLALGATSAMADELGEILQNGNGGAAYIEQTADNAEARINQGALSTGDIAAISQTQEGSDLIGATINQNTLGISGQDNVAGIVQFSTGTGTIGGTTALINQDGTANTAGVRQRNEGNDGTIHQTGDTNRAEVNQGDSPPGFNALESGNDTLADIGSSVDISNAINIPGINQGFFAGSAGEARNSTAIVDQFGDDNIGAVLQVEGNQFGSIEQIANENFAVVRQSDGDGNTGIVEQSGDKNTADVDQEGNTNFAFVYQPGVENNANVNQLGDDNSANVDQLGNLNTANVDQNGTGNDTFVFQDGDSNNADVDQVGTDNEAFVDQSGSGNGAVVDQNGTENFADIDQFDTAGDLATIIQTNDKNIGRINQSADNVVSVARIEQNGNENSGQINQ